MKEFIYSEMMVHVPMCTSKNPQNVLIISDNANVLAREILKHSDDISTKAVECSLDAVRDLDDSSVDVIICEMSSDSVLLAHLSRILKEDGQLSIKHPSLDEVEANKTMMKILGNYFKVIMPYNISNGSTALLASKEYHPTADINLHRADMLDNNQFYNCDVHIASFAMGNYIRKEYLGIIKN
ncbi:spermidine synthase [Sulfurimonas sp. CS5]|uniref:spermine/spermidine synthase domain-containing protein n=1 Tax=Sulfurimonas sp. CS5 TaxID=3391145 RepID=UPI0039EA7730